MVTITTQDLILPLKSADSCATTPPPPRTFSYHLNMKQYLRIYFITLLTDVNWSPTFKKVRIVASIWAQEEDLLWLGLGGQDGDGVTYTLYCDSIWCRHLAWQSHLCCGHRHQARTDLIQVKKIAGSLLSTLLQAHHDLTNTHTTCSS